MRYFSDRNIQKCFSQHCPIEDKSSPSCPQHSLGFSFVSGREICGHQKAQPLLVHIYMGIVEQYLLHFSLFFHIASCSFVYQQQWIKWHLSSSTPGIQHDPAWASGHYPGSWGWSSTGQSAFPQLPDTAAGSSLDCSTSRLTLSMYILSSPCHPSPPVTNECLCTAQGETPFSVT